MTTSAYDEIRHRSLATLEEQRIDPAAEPKGVADVVRVAVDRYQAQAHVGTAKALRDPSEMRERVLRSILEFGPLTDLLARRDIEEIFIEGSSVRYLDAAGSLRSLGVPTTEEENRHVVDRLLSTSDRRLDAASPMVQARVMDGTARLTAVIPPIADQLSVTIRRYALRRQTLESLVALESLSLPAAAFLRAAMQANISILVSGQPGAGKTSLLSSLLDAAPSTHCIRCCEEVRELSVPLVHGSYYETRPPSLDGGGEIDLRALVKAVLAMRPDRIVVGEVRGSEAFELTRAVNAGCGFLCTVHANSARDALNAIVNAALMAGENVTEPIVRKVFASCIDLVVHLSRETAPDGTIRRRVHEIIALAPTIGDEFTTEPIFHRDAGGALIWTGAPPPRDLVERIDRETTSGTVLAALRGGAS